MTSIPWITYLVLAGVAVVQAILLALQAWEHRRYARSCMGDMDRHRPQGRALILAPCKGAEFALEENLRALLRQDYRDYEITFVVEDADDPAVAVIRRVLADYPAAAARLLVAGRAAQSGQKVHNLRAATAVLPPPIRYLVFVDADAQPRPEWLRSLIGPLFEGEAEVATGYRWFTPARASLAHKLVYNINCAIMSLLGRSSQYMVWGGSWAIRRNTFDAVGLRAAWKGTLSDDLVAARVLRQTKRRVSFQPACVVISPLSLSLGEVLGFIRRQYLIARHYADFWWLLAILAATLRNAVWLGTLSAVACGLLYGTPAPWIPAALGVVLYGLGAYRCWLMQDLAGVYFPDRVASLRAFRRFAVWAAPLSGLVEWLMLLSTVLGRYVVWRGIRYRLLPRQRIAVERRRAEGGRGKEAATVIGTPSATIPAPHSVFLPTPNPLIPKIPKSLNP